MTRADLIALMQAAWTGDAASGLSSPLSAAQEAMIEAQLGAVADGILAALASGVPGSTPQWYPDTFAGTGTSFTLAHSPVSTAGVFVFLNGQWLDGCTFSGAGLKTLTIPIAKAASDTLFAIYQAIVPT